MQITVGPPQDDRELQELLAGHRRTYLMSAEEGAEWIERMPAEELRVVRRDGKVAGGLRLIDMGQWFGGRSVPMTGISSVGIDPMDRASGLASTLMRSVIEELHTKGTALSALYPATQPVYRRVGYELAGSWLNFSLLANTIDVRDRDLEVQLSDPVDRPLLERLYAERARRSSGLLDRPDGMWKNFLERPKTDVHSYIVSGASGPEGYVVFTQSRQKGWRYDLNLRDLVALTPAAARRLLTFFADHRSFANELKWAGGPADPFVFHLREQDWKIEWAMNWMLRIVDVQRALTERGYPSGLEAELHLEVRDNVLPANDGRFVLEVAGGKGTVRSGGEGTIRIDVRGLAPLYSGFLGAEELRATDYIDGADTHLATATAVFAGPAPWLADFF